jgi:hypothetical protein
MNAKTHGTVVAMAAALVVAVALNAMYSLGYRHGLQNASEKAGPLGSVEGSGSSQTYGLLRTSLSVRQAPYVNLFSINLRGTTSAPATPGSSR